MPRTDDPFAFGSGTLTIGTGEHAATVPAEGIDIQWTRGDWSPPAPQLFAGSLDFEGTLTGHLDQWSDLRNLRCPGCGIPWVELEPGHSWSSAREHCWTETGPIDEYGQPIREAA